MLFHRETLVALKDVSLRRGNDSVLDKVSLQLERGALIGLTGPNGAGKTSLFEAIVGTLHIKEGEISRAPSLKLAYLPQSENAKRRIPITVKEFVSMGTWSASSSGPVGARTLCVEEAMAALGLQSRAEILIPELAGGEWKRTLLARALVQEADLYLLDEPFNHLDLATEARVGILLKRLATDFGKSFFVISHDWHAMDHYLDRLILLNRKIVAQGSVREVLEGFMNFRDPSQHQWMHS